MDVQDAFRTTCRVLLQGEVGELDDFKPYLMRYVENVAGVKSALSGKGVTISSPEFSPGAKFISHVEMEEYNKRLRAVRLDLNSIKDIDSAVSALGEQLYYCGDIITGNSEAVGQMYVKKYFPAEAKQRMLILVQNLQESLGERINALPWMGDSTKVKAIEKLKKKPRTAGIVSRGGSLLTGWMLHNGKENPFYEHFDEVCDIAKSHDVTLSLGDGLRPGAIADATDSPQILELLTLGELQKKALRRGVQVMIEGPGHVPIDQIEANVILEKAICNGAPFYVLGPLVTDVAPGYDHITAAIGGAIAASKGADFLCYVTPSEHLRLPTLADVREGVIAARIAAHIADIAKNVHSARERDRKMSQCRKTFDWQGQVDLSIDPEKTAAFLEKSKSAHDEGCTMCGEFCAIKLGKREA